MRIALRVALALGALLLLAAGALLVLLPRLVESDAVRDRIVREARAATGREVGYEDLSIGLLPPRLVVEAPRIAGAAPDEPPFLEAESVGLRLTLLPLLFGSLVVDQVRVEGATLRLVRSTEGIELPRRPPRPEPTPAPHAPEAEPAAAPEADAALAVAVREARVSNARIVLLDRSVAPPVTWVVEDLDARAQIESLDGAIPFDVSAALASGGAIRANGTATLAGVVEAEARLERVSLDVAAAYAGPDTVLRGRLDGTLRLGLDGDGAARIAADATVDEADFARGDTRLRGQLSVRAELAGPPSALAGSFDADVSQAEFEYGAAVRKATGTRATASGRLVPQPDGNPKIEVDALKIKNLEAQVGVWLGPRPRVVIDAPPFETEGWDQLIRPLADYAPSGRIGLEALGVESEPLAVSGSVSIDDLRATVPDLGPIALRGRLEGRGDAVRFRDLELAVADQPLRIDGELRGLAGTPHLAARIRSRDADSNALLSFVSDAKDALYGPLDLDAQLDVPLADARSPVEALEGRARLEIACPPPVDPNACRLRGVSLLRSTVDRIGALGGLALAAGEARGGSTLQHFYGDTFRSILGTFTVSGGRARTDDLTLVYRGYTVELRGAIGLVDQGLDATGTLTIEEEVDAAVAESAGEAPAPGRTKVIPLARVTGTLQEPRIELSREAVVAFAASYSLGQRRDKTREKIDEYLGEGAGEEVLDALEGIFGGGKR
ncbi:MAG: DUF748 domain-containing protein [Deltaproteobacteria bacterium]|nr:MAG: DUF748 domain-containing protein [Deltaproteobacteria bacterium]